MKRLAAIIGATTLIVIIAAISAVVGGILWTYSLNTWLVFFGKSAVVLWWQGALLGLIPGLGQMSLPLAVITWIAMMFLA